ncbi:MAG: heme-binding protein [Kibdelosporangium sp.]
MFVVQRCDISLELARVLAAGVRAEAAQRGVAMAVTVVDRSGQLVLSERMDGATPASVHLAQDKAYTASAFGAPTDAWAEVTTPGGADWGMAGSVGGRIMVLPGGVPVRIDGELVGGLGVSGAAPPVDVACAVAGLAAGMRAVQGLDESAVLPKPHATIDLSDKQTG